MSDLSQKSKEELIQEIERLRSIIEDESLVFPGLSVISKLEKNLLQIDEKYKALLTTANEGIFLVKDGEILEVNEKAAKLFRCKRKEMEGKSILSLASKNQSADFNKDNLKFLREELLLPGKSIQFVWQMCRLDGSVFDAEVSFSVISIANQPHIYLLVRDVSDKVKLREAIKKIGEEQLLSGTGNWIFDLEGSNVFWSDSLHVMHQLPLNERPPLLKKYLRDYVHPEDHDLLKTNIQDAVSRGSHFECDIRVLLPDGKEKFFHLKCKPKIDNENNVKQLFGTCLDITQRKRLEHQLIESKEGYKMLVENLPEGVIIYRLDKILYANKQAFEISNTPYINLGEPLDVTIFDYLLTKYHKEVRRKIGLLLKGKNLGKVEMKLKCFDGIVLDIEVRSNVIDYKGERCIQAIFSDITYRKKVERALKEKERQLYTLISNLPGMAYRCLNDRNWTLEFISEGCLSLTGYREDEFLVKKSISLAGLIYEEDRQFVWENVQKALAEDRAFSISYRIKRKDGQIRWVYEQGKSVGNNADGELALEGFVTDITRRKKAEEELFLSRENYKNLVEFLPVGIVIHKQGVIQFVNKQSLRMLKIGSPDAVVNTSVFKYIPEEYHQPILERIQQAYQGVEQGYFEIKVIADDKELIDVETKSIPFLFNGEQCVLVVMNDLRSEKMLQRQADRIKYAEEVNRKLVDEITKREALQEELLKNQTYTKNILNSSLDMIIANDRNGNITEFNKAAQEQFGLTAQEAIGTPIKNLYGNEEDFLRVRKQLREKGIFTGEIENINSKGERFATFLTATGLFDDEGKVIGGMGVSRDITQLKKDQVRLRTSEENYKAIYNQALIAISIIDLDGLYIDCNQHFLQMLNMTRDEILNQSYHDVTAEESLVNAAPILDKLRKGEN
jgi:PAS domain S-box-containing protein